MKKIAMLWCFVLLVFTCFATCMSAEELTFDFESGNLENDGWIIIEGNNSKPIGSRSNTYNTPFRPYDRHGEYYLTTLETAEGSNPTDDNLCVIESPVFVIRGNEARLFIGGGAHAETYAALSLVDEQGNAETVRKAHGRNDEQMEEVVWETTEFQGRQAVFQLVDQKLGGWGHIRADWFRIEGTIDPRATQFRRNTYVTILEQKKELDRKQREAAVNNPLLQAQPILYVVRAQYRPDHHNTATMFQTGEINTGSFIGGGALRVWNPADDSVKILLDLPEGIVRDPCLSFDAKTVLISIRRNIQDDYHIYEFALNLENSQTLTINGETDLEGTPLKQLTFMSGVSDIDPLYLPSGEIMFSSTREPKYCMCNRHIMCNLFVMNGDGSNIHQVGKSTLFEGHASLTSTGQVLYDRWEYVDRNFGDAQGVWIANPDGTNHAIYWGNNTPAPGGVIDARVLPNDDSIMLCTFTSCHDRPWGAIALVDRRLGIDGREPVLQTWPPEAIDLVGQGNYDTFIPIPQKFEDPYPLSSEWFLASGMTGQGEQMGIFLLGRDGTMVLIHKGDDEPGCFDPTPIRTNPIPQIYASRVDLTQDKGYFYVADVYQGHGMEAVPKGTVKSLRVVESPEKRFWVPQAWDGGTGEQAPGMAWDDFNNKRILGTVDIEADGSAYFEVPADRFLYLQLLDKNGMMVQSMRSGMIARPGELNGCVGCHESRLDSIPPLAYTPEAMQKPPRSLNPWHGPERLFSYVHEVQPVFDRYCVACHDYDNRVSETQPNLAGDLNLVFNTSYVELRDRKLVQVPGAGPWQKLNPYTWGSHASRLAEVLLNGHSKPEIDQKRKDLGIFFDHESDPESFDRIITWIDLNAPYYPVYASAYPDNPAGRSPLSYDTLQQLAELCGYHVPNLVERSVFTRSDPFYWSVSLTRPEISPCLSRWATDQEKRSPEYQKALGIIKQGRDNINQVTRGENPDLMPSIEKEKNQQAKYDRLIHVRSIMQDAMLSGQKRFDQAHP